MSGLVVGYGQPNREDVETMFEKIEHRGPALSGRFQRRRAVLAQNYAGGDLARGGEGAEVPVVSSYGEGMRICYDGQMGNWAKLAADHGVADGPFREERLLLELYRKYGSDMLRYLGDTIFALVISDGEKLFAARDLLGIKTLFYGRENGTLYLASELKSLRAVTDDIREFPEGHFMDADGKLTQFAELPESPEVTDAELPQIIKDVRDIIERSVRNRVNFVRSTAALLSGGMDSSVISYLSSRLYKEQFGEEARLKTFAMGVGESSDIRHARTMAKHIGSDHQELIVDLSEILDALPEVIYCLESFDPSLVRSAVSNYLISKRAAEEGVEVLLSGEGGDEIFCGYTYLKNFPPEQLTAKQIECLGYLHSNASLRLDRMNQCNSVRVVAPLISGELLDYALRIPPQYKQKPEGDGKIEKWIFRKAYESVLPRSIVWRGKQEFSQGSGSADVLPGYFEDAIDDREYAEARERHPLIRSKEEFYYFRVFTEYFGADRAVETVGQWVTL
ncbi:MAG: asparagine synthase-related protein [Planctomycetota bacterium]